MIRKNATAVIAAWMELWAATENWNTLLADEAAWQITADDISQQFQREDQSDTRMHEASERRAAAIQRLMDLGESP